MRENEVVFITGVSDGGRTIDFKPPLKYKHISVVQNIGGRVVQTRTEVKFDNTTFEKKINCLGTRFVHFSTDAFYRVTLIWYPLKFAHYFQILLPDSFISTRSFPNKFGLFSDSLKILDVLFRPINTSNQSYWTTSYWNTHQSSVSHPVSSKQKYTLNPKHRNLSDKKENFKQNEQKYVEFLILDKII